MGKLKKSTLTETFYLRGTYGGTALLMDIDISPN